MKKYLVMLAILVSASAFAIGYSRVEKTEKETSRTVEKLDDEICLITTVKTVTTEEYINIASLNNQKSKIEAKGVEITALSSELTSAKLASAEKIAEYEATK